MARQILAQAAPSATTWEKLYTCPVDTNVDCDTLSVCNEGGAAATFRLSINIGGAAADGDTAKEYIYYNVSVDNGDTFLRDFPPPLNSGDVIWIYASTATVGFTLCGNPGVR